jgi:hypothetical protein
MLVLPKEMRSFNEAEILDGTTGRHDRRRGLKDLLLCQLEGSNEDTDGNSCNDRPEPQKDPGWLGPLKEITEAKRKESLAWRWVEAEMM